MLKFLATVAAIFVAFKVLFVAENFVADSIGGFNAFLLAVVAVTAIAFIRNNAKPKEPSFSEDCIACRGHKSAKHV